MFDVYAVQSPGHTVATQTQKALQYSDAWTFLVLVGVLKGGQIWVKGNACVVRSFYCKRKSDFGSLLTAKYG